MSVKNNDALASFYTGALHNVETLLDTDHAIENKINAIMAASLVAMIFIADNVGKFDTLLIIGLALLGLGVCVALFSTRIKTYFTGTVSLEQNYDYIKKVDQELLLQIISDAEEAFAKIQAKVDHKALAYMIILGFFVSGIAFSLLSLIIRR